MLIAADFSNLCSLSH